MQWLTPSAPGRRPVLDVTYLTRLESHLGEETVTELLADGLLELTDKLDRLAELTRTDDHDAVRKLAHDLVATAGHLGLSALSIAAVDMQRRARGDTRTKLNALTAPVLRLTEPSLTALGQHLESLYARGP